MDSDMEWGSDVEAADDWDSDTSSVKSDTWESDKSDQDSDDEISDENDKNPLDHVVWGKKVTVDVAPRFGLTGASYFFGFKNQDQIVDAAEVARCAFDKILEDVGNELGSTDLMGVSIAHPALDHEILVSFGDKSTVTTENVMRIIGSVQQSKKELDFDSTMNVKVTRIRPPKGSGYRKLAKGRFAEVFRRHSSGHGSAFIQIKNNDWLCFPRAVVVAKARTRYYNLDDKSVQWDTIKRGDARRCTLQRIQALDLMTRAGLLGYKERVCGISEMRKIQKCLIPEGFQLKVFSKDHFDAIVFDEELVGPIPLYIYHHDNHYTPMSSPRYLTGTNHYCDLCNRGYDKIESHKCPKRCPCCKTSGACHHSAWITCPDCDRRFKSIDCFNKHRIRPETYSKMKNSNKRRRVLGSSICMRLKLCRECGRCVSKCHLPPEKHNCGSRYCSICKKWEKADGTHECFMQPLKSGQTKESENDWQDLLPEELADDSDDLDSLVREEENRQGETDASRQIHFKKHSHSHEGIAKYLFWDFETTQQDKERETKLGPSYLHKPNYCIVRKACMLCKDYWLSKCPDESCKSHSCQKCVEERPQCPICKEHILRFQGDKCRDNFCDFLFQEAHRGITAIAHNAKGFDAHFVIQWLIKEKRIPKIVPRGLQILSIESMGVKIIDSFCFISQSLESMPKTFNEPELKKGYFPFLFCRRENWDYVGPLPDADQYCPSQMKSDAREKFYDWYREHKNQEFIFKKELKEYCESDVDILLRCMLKFNDLFHRETGVFPLEVAITIAQACNHVFRRNFLRKNTIGVVPAGGYRGRERQSLVALEWLKWMSHSLGVEIQHARNGKEKVIGNYKVDGFFGNTALEFHGCAFHGCLKHCKNREKKVPNSHLTFEEAYQRTVEKSEFLRKAGYEVIEVWECEWREKKSCNPDIMEFVDDLEFSEILDPRKSLAGGRTNATVLWHKCSPGEKILFYDVCSLYPYICKYSPFPLKHPKVITENFQPISRDFNPYFGLIHCRVIAPKNLLHPVLPYKWNDRLNFALCRTCLENNQQNACVHSDYERGFTSTFVSLELDKALQLGYTVDKVFEVWHYEEKAVYDGENESTGLFTTYINKFLKLKTQANGYPPWVRTEEDKDRFILEYEQKEGIQLDREQIEVNNGLRALAKICLNSFWGIPSWGSQLHDDRLNPTDTSVGNKFLASNLFILGKFAQKSDNSLVEFFTEPNEFFDTIFDSENNVTNVRSLGPDMVAVNYKKDEVYERVNPNTSVVLAAFVTASARLKLYSFIEKLQDRVLYFDTDSIIFLQRPSDVYCPPLGDYLGDLTDELTKYGTGSFISEFCSGGPKQYSYRVKNGAGKIVKTITKCKGFSLNYSNAAHINFKRMKKQVKQYVKQKKLDVVTVYNREIRRTKNHEIVTLPTCKVQKVVYCKRIVRSDFSTVPFGYVKE